MNPFTKILRWAFVQAFGSKAKTFIDQGIKPGIIAIIGSQVDLQSAIDAVLGSDALGHFEDAAIKTLKIPAIYAPFVKPFIDDEVRQIIASIVSHNKWVAALTKAGAPQLAG